ncbi:hypothetical protein HUE57_02045 [Candidatus Reidiella endopervernicosa]|uniref:Cytochrome c domain-containing protein n=1 Tax=Candidatus Reidiella endopervernicosa TaxID=2738883 RepID=A0A6N0HSD4_9GAMM|nr:hypothetical protein HUE57_02045 [Candidatus Reidiella endopervernicosa]
MKLRTLSIISMALMLNVGCNSGGSSGVSIEAADTAASDTNTETIDEATETTITTDIETLGGLIYNDDNLSSPPSQSCASCHTIGVGFDDPDSGDPTSLGADGSSIGNRNSPTTGYAAPIPEPQTVTRTLPDGTTRQAFIGGQFLDGRADTLEEQAKGPSSTRSR